MGSLQTVDTTPRMFASTGSMPVTRSGRVLVAEDDSEMRQLIAQGLAKDGHQVVQAADGVQLVAHVTDSLRDGLPLDLVISDVRMPGLTGFEAMEWLRSLGCRAPIVLITAFGDPHTHLEGARLGAMRVLDKPFDLDDLRRLAGSLLDPKGGRSSPLG